MRYSAGANRNMVAGRLMLVSQTAEDFVFRLLTLV